MASRCRDASNIQAAEIVVDGGVSRITLFDEAASTAFDGLPASASRLL
jgi:hypothetical protein